MSKYAYPYIADKTEYAATMYACQLIRKYGTFNVACRTAARRYGISQDIVEEHVRARQGAGQKKAAKENPRKYHYYLIETSDSGHSSGEYRYYIEKATSKLNAMSHIHSRMYGPDGEYDSDLIERTAEFDSENDAKREGYKWIAQRKEEKRLFEEQLKKEFEEKWEGIKARWLNGEDIKGDGYFESMFWVLPDKKYIPDNDICIYDEIVKAEGRQRNRSKA